MYRQFDGYPSGHGAELAEFLASGKMVNGLSGDDTSVFNGMCCLAAQMVAHFKKEPGGIYLMVPTPGADHGQEYEYHVRFEDYLRVKVRDEIRRAINERLILSERYYHVTWGIELDATVPRSGSCDGVGNPT
jgi:hypothetical protein